MKSIFKNFLFFLIVILGLAYLFNTQAIKTRNIKKVAYSQLVQEINDGNVSQVEIEDRHVLAVLKDKNKIATYIPLEDKNLLPALIEKGVKVIGISPESSKILPAILIHWLPMIVMLGFFFFLLRKAGGGDGKGGPFSFGKSRAVMLKPDKTKITFADVAGIEEAKADVEELVDFLKNPLKYQKLGGKIPCGVLLLGSPGTGKTLLAKAVAGEAKVPFFLMSGSDFVEMFVGVGASRVRDLFETAKKNAPCIIFIDEIDAVGRHRGAGLGGGHDEREQTLNQLLVEMDGFMGKEGIIVMAATNRPDVLDPALLRPGRFDRQVYVPLPDIKGREAILKVHMKKVPVDSEVDAALIARGTAGFSGAELANLVNEAALIAAKNNSDKVDVKSFDKARDKILMGSERKSMLVSDKEKAITAYHEAGHVVVGYCLAEDGHDPVYKATIIPRGMALGVTTFLPKEDHYSYSKKMLENQIAVLFGGRIAELLQYGAGEVTAGAANDIERATNIARNMVTRWGLSEKMGPLAYSKNEGEIFLGKTIASKQEISDVTVLEIDKEIRRIIDDNYGKALSILDKYYENLQVMAKALIKFETLDAEQIKEIMDGNFGLVNDSNVESEEVRATE